MFISFPRAAKALLFLPNGVLIATAPAPIVCISVRRETVSIARPSGAPDLRRPTDIATLYHADSMRTLLGFRLRSDPARQSGNILEATSAQFVIKCLNWVKSGHRIRSASYILYPQKRTCAVQLEIL